MNILLVIMLMLLFIVAFVALGLKISVEAQDRKKFPTPAAYKFDVGDIVTLKKGIIFDPIFWICLPSRVQKIYKNARGKPFEISFKKHEGYELKGMYDLVKSSDFTTLPEYWLKLQFTK